jgi:hypothetical protein
MSGEWPVTSAEKNSTTMISTPTRQQMLTGAAIACGGLALG